MNQAARLEVYKAQTQNVRAIDKYRAQINRTINLALKRGDVLSAEAHTKAMALVFCAWVEANFSKVIHTPYGFTLNEIQQIKTVYQNKNLETGWEKCIQLSLRKIAGRHASNYIPNIRQELLRIIQSYVVEPSRIRNKIAHGQWEIALNSDNTAINKDLSKPLRDLDIVTIRIWFQVHEHLARIIEALIESPNGAFHRDYQTELAKLNAFIAESRKWNLQEKIALLKQKPIRTPN